MSRVRAAALLPRVLIAVALLTAFAAWFAVWRSWFGFHPGAGGLATVADAMLRSESPAHAAPGVFLSTFYFPPFPALLALAHAIGLDWLASLRVVSLVTGVSQLIASAIAARALGAGARGAWLAAALVATTYPFKSTLIDARVDLLAADLALMSLAAWVRDEDARGWWFPAFAAASWLIKASSVTAPAAFLLSALARRNRGALRFVIRFAICVAAGVALSLPIHGPAWYWDAIRTLRVHVNVREDPLRGLTEPLRYLGSFAELAIFATLAIVWLAGRRDRRSPPFFFAIVSLSIVIYVLSNYAADQNHLVELAATAAVYAALWADARLSRRAALPALALAIAVLGASWRDLAGVVRHAREPGNLRASVIAAVRGEPAPVLAEDPLLALAAGRRPMVADLDRLRAVSMTGAPNAMRIIDALHACRYGLIVLNDDLAVREQWVKGGKLRDPTVAPIRAGYVPSGNADGFFLYRRRGPASPLDRPATRP